MANAFNLAFTLPDERTFRPGEPLLAVEVAKVFECLNVATAYVSSGVVWQQTWIPALNIPDAETVTLGPIFIPNDMEGNLFVLAKSSTGVDITLERLPSEGESDLVVDLGDPFDNASLVGGGAVQWGNNADNRVLLHITESGGGSIDTLVVVVARLTSPLAAAPQGRTEGRTTTPFDPDTAVAGAAMPAVRGEQIGSTIQALLFRSDVQMQWIKAPGYPFPEHSHGVMQPLYPRHCFMNVGSDEGMTFRLAVGGRVVQLVDGSGVPDAGYTWTAEFDKVSVDAIDTGHRDPLTLIMPQQVGGDPFADAIETLYIRAWEPGDT